MIDATYPRLMARYNAWQNDNLYAAADTLDDAARRRDRGAFFGSIHGTLSHLMWADAMWMHRLAGLPKPAEPLAQSAMQWPDWDKMRAGRRAMDQAIAGWATGLKDAALAGDLEWFSGATGQQMIRPVSFVIVHMFNHQTHHRGQVHALLTAAGACPQPTDLMMLEP